MSDTSKKLQDMITTIMELDDEVRPETLLTDDLGMASIDFVELSVVIEKTFKVPVPQDFLVKGICFEELLQYVEGALPVGQ